MASATPAVNSYDELPYPSQPLPQTDPSRLAAVAMLFGMQPVPPDKARVLELGCASGGNLIPLADRYSGSRFVGVDYSKRQIDAARLAVDFLQLTNVEFRHCGLEQLDESIGKFDYILCHGVFSWVEPPTQAAILELCRRHLSEQGVAYISYNVFPMWYLRRSLRELFAAGEQKLPPDARAARAAEALRDMSAALAEASESPYVELLREQIDQIVSQPPSYLFHEYLEADNRPMYFHEFVARAAEHRLQYLGDPAPRLMFPSGIDPEVGDELMQLSWDTVSAEQHLDLLRNTGFRQSLACHGGLHLSRYLTPRQLAGVCLSAHFRPKDGKPVDLSPGVMQEFEALASSNLAGVGGEVSSASASIKSAIVELGMIWPRSVRYEILLDQVDRRLTQMKQPLMTQADREQLGNNLIHFLASGMLDVLGDSDAFVSTLSARPRASRVARWQAANGVQVTNQRHELIPLDSMSNQILSRLDGQHDRQSLLAILKEEVKGGTVSVLIDGIPTSVNAETAPLLERMLDDALAKMAYAALLIA